MAKIVQRVPTQRQQAHPPKSAKDVQGYLVKQQKNLQRDWRTIGSAVNSLTTVGLAAELPPAGAGGRIFLAIDTRTLYMDTGSGQWFGVHLPL
jgi:hypothetical protein